MKYLVFKQTMKSGTSVFHPVIMSDHSTHACLTMEGATVDSAGFCYHGGDGQLMVDQNQEASSLKIGPKWERDTILLANMIEGFGIYGFVDQE